MPDINQQPPLDIGRRENIYVPIYVDVSGQQRRTPSTGILDIAGIYSSNFTVGGKAILFADGTSSDGSAALDLQNAYFHSPIVGGSARINLAPGKNFTIGDDAGTSFITIDAVTGKITINGEMAVISSIAKFTGDYQEFDHVNILSNDGLKPSFYLEPKEGVTFAVDPVVIKTQFGGITDFAIDVYGQTYIDNLMAGNITGDSLIDNVEASTIVAHLSPTASPFKHFAEEIRFTIGALGEGTEVSFESDVSVQDAISNIINTFSQRFVTLRDAINLILADENSELAFFQRIATLETNVTDLSSNVTLLGNRVTTVETQVQNLSNALNNIHTANVAGINFEQFAAAGVWTIHHNTNSKLVQFTVYDENDRLVWPDDAFALDFNTFVIVFGNPQRGRAILACLIPPVSTMYG